MSGDKIRLLTPKPRSTWFTVTCILAWSAAAALAVPLGIWPAMGGVALVLGAFLLLVERPALVDQLKPNPRHVFLGGSIGCMMAGVTYLVYPPLSHTLPVIPADTARLYAAFRAPSQVVVWVLLIPVILGEEMVWRGVVQSSLVSLLGAWRGVALTAIVYALTHVALGSPVLIAAAFSCGLVWGALRAATSSLVPSLMAHLLWNILVLLWLPLDAR